MNADRLLAHYKRIADAPDAISRMRQFILDLAVRGKLVVQDSTEEPASELLKRIIVEKGKICKRPNNLPEINSTQELGEPPLSWCVVPLIALGSWAIGSGFPKNEQGMSVGPYFFLKVSDMNLPGNEKFITTANHCIDDDAAARMRAKIHPPGTIIFPKIGGAIATNKRRILTKRAAIDNNCLGITPSSHLDAEWIFLLLTTLDFAKYQAGTAVPALQQGTLESISIGLPPLAEQHRIVAKVDELMALCGGLEAARAEREATRDRLTAASLARLDAPNLDPAIFRVHAAFALDTLAPLTTRPDQIKVLRQTILNLAVRGKLVAQNPNDEPASELLRRIIVEKGKICKRPNNLPEINSTQELGEPPLSWCVVPLIALGSWAIGSGFPKNEQGMSVGPYFFLKVSDMNLPGNEKFITTANHCIDDDAAARMRAKIHPPGTIIFPKIGGAIATNKRRILTKRAAIDNNCLGITPSSHLDAEWIFLLLTTLDFAKYQAGTAVPALQQGTLESISIGLPPLAEQHRIVAKVDELMALCGGLEESLTTGNDACHRLFDALLAEALDPHKPER